MIKLLCSSTLGLVFGYLSGYCFYFSSSIIKLSLLILVAVLFFSIKIKNDIWLKYVLHVTLAFIIFFIYANIVGHNYKVESILKSEKIDTQAIVKDITKKDGSTVVEVEFVKNSTSSLSFRNAVVYTNNLSDIYPDDLIRISGEVSNQYIIFPKDKEVDYKSFDLARYWQTKNIDGVMFNAKISSSSADFVTTGNFHSFNYFSYKFRESFIKQLNIAMPNEEAGIVMAMLLGDDSGISKDTNDKYTEGGLSHVLVLSGYNLSVIGLASILILSKFSFRKRIIGSSIFVIIFLILAKTSISVWRAAFMSFYVLISSLFMRDINLKFIVWLCAFLFCLLSPLTAMFDSSFHLSILATIGIVYFYSGVRDSFFKTNVSLWKESFLVTFSATLTTAPYLMYQFGYFNIMGLFVSSLVTIFVPLIMFFGFISGILVYLSPFLGKVFGYFCFLLVNSMTALVNMSANSGSLISGPISFYFMCLLYFFIFIIYLLLSFYLSYKK